MADAELEAFNYTTTGLARIAGTTGATVRLYDDLGLLPFRVASNGVRLHRRSDAGRVREIMVERLRNRGGNRRRA